MAASPSNTQAAQPDSCSIVRWGSQQPSALLLALGVAVAVAMASLPDYDQLSRRTDLGQMVRVRAADGSVAGVARAELRPLAEL